MSLTRDDVIHRPERVVDQFNIIQQRLSDSGAVAAAVATGTYELAAGLSSFSVTEPLAADSDDIYIGVEQEVGGPRVNQVIKQAGAFRVVLSNSSSAARTFSWIVVDKSRALIGTRGPKGETGSQGPRGIAGRDGSDGADGATRFLALTDTPGTLTAGKWFRVNTSGTALEEVDEPRASGVLLFSDNTGHLVTDGGWDRRTNTVVPTTGSITLSENARNFDRLQIVCTDGSGYRYGIYNRVTHWFYIGLDTSLILGGVSPELAGSAGLTASPRLTLAFSGTTMTWTNNTAFGHDGRIYRIYGHTV